MKNWAEIFKSARRSGLYNVADDVELNVAGQAALAAGMRAVDIDLHGVSDKEGLLKSIAGPLQFPGYFGMNWDALEECLKDLSWLPAKGYLLLLHGAAGLDKPVTGDIKTLFIIFRRAVTCWKKAGTPFFVLFSV